MDPQLSATPHPNAKSHICELDDTAGYLTIFRYLRMDDDSRGLGFGISLGALSFLAFVGAELDIDEYDYTDGDSN